MRHRVPLLLALLLIVSIPLAPAVTAAQPPSATAAPTVDPTASPDPTPSATPSDEPSAEPTPAAESTPDPTRDADPTDAASPSADASPSDEASPSADPTPAPSASDPAPAPSATPAPRQAKPAARGGLDPRGRYIVVLKPGSDVRIAAKRTVARGATVAGTFKTAIHGYVARLSASQKRQVAADPAVAMIVPDEIVSITAQNIPNGIRRIKTTSSSVARIDGIDQRVDADVAIVDTGIDSAHPDLNVAGGYNCSTSNRGLWRDMNRHGTHVAGTVGAKDGGYGVVGVAPGVRLWAVKILNDEGFGYLSWYVCGLDWIASRRDPVDPSRPLFEAVNMSVAKSGSDDRACGTKNKDILHAAICRVVAAGIPVVAAAGNDRSNASTLVPASYDEVITVSALADTDGKSGGQGGNSCYSWGTYDQDDTLADFSNGGYDVDLIAPGKCIWSTLPGKSYGYSSGTSMAAPHVTGAVALYKSTRPHATNLEVKAALQYLGTYDWKTWTDRDSFHEKLLDVSRLDGLGDFSLSLGSAAGAVGETGGSVTLPIGVGRSASFFERVKLSAVAEAPLTVKFGGSSSLFGFTAKSSSLTVSVPKATPSGTYTIRITGRNWDRERTASATLTVTNDLPTASAPIILPATSSIFSGTSLTARAVWAPARDATSSIAGYEVQVRTDSGAWGSTRTVSALAARLMSLGVAAGHTYSTRIRARDAVGNWSAWAESAPVRMAVTQDSSTAVTYGGTWTRWSNRWLSGRSDRYATRAGATAKLTFTGRSVALVVAKGPSRGAAKIWIDGSYVGTVSLYASSFRARRIVWSRGWATSGTHTVTVQVAGTAGHPRVDVDAFVILK